MTESKKEKKKAKPRRERKKSPLILRLNILTGKVWHEEKYNHIISNELSLCLARGSRLLFYDESRSL